MFALITISFGCWIIPVLATIAFIVFMLVPSHRQDTYGIGAFLDFVFGVIVLLAVWVLYLATALIFGIK